MKLFVAMTVFLTLANPLLVAAFYTNANIATVSHDAPAWFEADGVGGFYGATTAGTKFTQQPVVNARDVRLHKFKIGTAFWYISDRGVIEAPDDLIALSIYLSLV